MDTPKISIIIPCYNQAKYIAEAIESVYSQTLKDFELIVVNDGSTDNLDEVMEQFINLDPPILYIKQENKGLPTARNNGIRASKGQYILCLDADDKLDPLFLELTEDEADIVGTAQKEFGERDNIHYFKPEPTYYDFLTANQINCCSLFKREVWDKTGGYDETMRQGYEDWDFWIRATKLGFTVKTIPAPLFFYRIHGDSMTFQYTRPQHQKFYQQIIQKHNV